MSLQLTWLGTAGFILKAPDFECAFDPFLSRKNPASPSPFTPQHFSNVKSLFLGHGHFDHIADVPAIAKNSDLIIYAAADNIKKLRSLGVKHSQTIAVEPKGKKSLINEVNGIKVFGFDSRHVFFDSKLVFSTIQRCGFKNCVHIAELGVKYPMGGVRTYYLEIKGKKILFISSAGCTHEEIAKYRALQIDILLIPLQGHSNIQTIAGEIILGIQPKIVIPHHHDDFYQPMSQNISLEPLLEYLKIKSFKGQFVELPLFSTTEI